MVYCTTSLMRDLMIFPVEQGWYHHHTVDLKYKLSNQLKANHPTPCILQLYPSPSHQTLLFYIVSNWLKLCFGCHGCRTAHQPVQQWQLHFLSSTLYLHIPLFSFSLFHSVLTIISFSDHSHPKNYSHPLNSFITLPPSPQPLSKEVLFCVCNRFQGASKNFLQVFLKFMTNSMTYRMTWPTNQ